MIRKTILFVFLFVSLVTFAQDKHSQWSVTSKPLTGNEILIEFKCDIDSGWHIYSQEGNKEAFIPKQISIEYSTDFNFLGSIVEPAPIKHFDENFEVQIDYHEGTVVFSQKVERKVESSFLIKYSISGLVCNDRGCNPEPVDSSLEVKAGDLESESVLWVFWAGLIAGFVALLTPCVFPMIPLTVTFFTKQAKSKSGGIMKAVIYGLSIIVLYVSLGMGVTAILGEEVLGNMASSVIFNLFFFVILIVFAISFLGVFEITLPAFLVNNIDSKADKGGWIGIFFMAFALALVSFSCTGPLIGTLLVEAAVNGGVMGPLLGMLGFSIALALPFTLFAIFPSWLNSLPKSGGWLNSVKVVLGLLEIALALKFLSNADLVYQALVIPRELFVVLWILIFIVIVFYLLGKIKFPHDSPIGKLSGTRKVISTIFIAFTIYLFTGLFGAPLKLLSGVLPPSFYSWSLWSVGGDAHAVSCPNDLNCFHDIEEGIKESIKVKKPILLDFTGWTCTNCRYVEQNIWTSPAIDSLIRNEFVLVSLYTDDKRALSESEQFVSSKTQRQIQTIGDKWQDYEIVNYGTTSLPSYVIVDENKSQLIPKFGYTTSPNEYLGKLKAGLKEYKSKLAN